jgi:HTH-type transcriptional regulator / antitoxin HigA
MVRGNRKQQKPHPYEPDYAVPPGRTLQETIDSLDLDQRELAQRTGLSVKHVNQVIKGTASITQDTAIRLERVTGVPARMWNNLEANYREQLARLAERSQLQGGLDWLKTIPVKELIQRRKIDERADKLRLLEEVLRFFGVANVDAWREGWETPQFAFRKSAAFAGRTGAMATWLRLCELAAAEVRCQPFSKARFQAALQKVRPLTVMEPDEFVPAMTAYCAAAGVAVVLVPELKGTPVSGAAKWLTARKALIGLNLRGKSNDRFWFTFFHEAGHVLHDSKKQTYIDIDVVNDPQEERANRFAANFLIPPDRATELPNLTSCAAVETFARSLGIAPGIVVGRLQHDGIIPFSHLNRLKRRLQWSKEDAM